MRAAVEALATGSSFDPISNAPSSRYQPLVLVAAALAAGVIANQYSGWNADAISFSASWFAAGGLLIAWWLMWRRGHLRVSAALVVIAVALTGAAWHELRWNNFPRDDIGRFARNELQPACARGVVLSTPEFLPARPETPLRAIPALERSRLEVELTRIRDGTRWRSADGRCQLIVDGHLLGVNPGDAVEVFAQLARPSPTMNPGEFDFAAHNRSERRMAILNAQSPDCVTLLETGAGGWLVRAIDALRGAGKRLLQTYVPHEQAGLAAAILLGDREALPRESIEPFMLTGTVHLLVVSGLNVAILATGLYAAMWLGWLPRQTALAGIIAAVVLYTLVTGAEPPVLRAAVLVVLVCVAQWTGRRGVAYNSLAAAAILVLALNPAELFGTGTQLSFLCVAVLIWVGQWKINGIRDPLDPLDRLIAATRPWHEKLGTSVWHWTLLLLITSTAVWLATLPLVLFRFHVASPVALLIAPLVWVFATVAMWAGFITLAFGSFMPLAAAIAGPICGWSIAWLVDVVNWSESLPGGHIWAPGPARWWIVGFYLALGVLMVWGWPRWRMRSLAATACVWILVGLAPPLARPWLRGDELRVAFLAVGHGACAVVETPSGQTLLYDAGSLSSPEAAAETISGYLWHRGQMRIDAIILSHADVDHYNAVPALLDRFRIGAVYVSRQMFDFYGATGPPTAPEVLQQAVTGAGVPLHEVWSGDRLRVGDGVSLEVLHPPRDGVIGSDNANSIVLAIEYAGRRILLPGDLEAPGLNDLIAELPIDCDIVMAPHHGSRRSDPPGFAAWTSPEWAVISGGSDADPAVRRTYEDAGAVVLNTGEVGLVDFTVRSDSVTVAIWRAVRGAFDGD